MQGVSLLAGLSYEKALEKAKAIRNGIGPKKAAMIARDFFYRTLRVGTLSK